MQIVKVNAQNDVESIMNISGLSASELTQRYPDYLIHSFNFAKPMQCYSYDDANNTFVLKANWESLIPSEPAPTPPEVSAITFKMLFTSAERVALRALKTTDPIVEDFFDLVDDPRTNKVDLSMQSVQDGILYCLNALATQGVINNSSVSTRQAQILKAELVL